MSSLYDLLTVASMKLGGDPITSLTADTVETETWAAIWEPRLQTCLSAHVWNFATATQELSKLLDAPADPRYLYQFDLPADFSTSRYFLDPSGVKREEYRIEGKRLFTSLERIIAVYGRSYGEDDIPLLPSWFTDFYCSSLANEAAEKLAGIGSVKQAIAQETGILFNKAKLNDARLAPPVRIQPGHWSAVR